MNAEVVIEAPERGASIEPSTKMMEGAAALFHLTYFEALDDNCVVQPLGQEPMVAGMPTSRKMLVYDVETNLFALVHIQKPNDENSHQPYGVSISRPDAADCLHLSSSLLSIGANIADHHLNPLFIQYRRSVRKFAEEEIAFDAQVQQKLTIREINRRELLKATGI